MLIHIISSVKNADQILSNSAALTAKTDTLAAPVCLDLYMKLLCKEHLIFFRLSLPAKAERKNLNLNTAWTALCKRC
jgi:hypothetical protein